ncbi:hypothetical protein GOD64_03895 [Sinorhizobium medicae]|nr:hypothetical protein [Sinorhizobium medicae]
MSTTVTPGQPLDHEDFRLDRPKIMNVIDSKELRRGMRAETAYFPHPALESQLPQLPYTGADPRTMRQFVAFDRRCQSLSTLMSGASTAFIPTV